jgi:protease I
MSLSGKRVAILLENMYEDQEFWYPYYRLKGAGAQVVIVAPKAGTAYTSKHGYEAKSNVAAADVKGSDFDGVVIPGGYSPDLMRRVPAMVNLVRDAHHAGKIIGSICHAAWMLCSADVLKGRTITCFFSIKDDVKHAGAEYVDQEVVIDGNLITSRSPADLPAYCEAIVAALEK